MTLTEAAPTTVVRAGALDHLDALEAHAIFIIREVAAELRNPVVLFSGGKDSVVVLHLVAKAMAPAPFPFAVMHVDTGHNFDEVIEFRDPRRSPGRAARRRLGPAVDRRRPCGDPGAGASRNRLQSVTLLDAIAEHGLRRLLRWRPPRRRQGPGEGADLVVPRRVRSVGSAQPASRAVAPLQRRVRPGEHVRAFPISDWTELDVWRYIEREGLELPSIYFAHEREVVQRDGMFLAVNEWVSPAGDRAARGAHHPLPHGRRRELHGCGGLDARSVSEVIDEISVSRITERGATRADDRFSDAAMEDRKREGYF